MAKYRIQDAQIRLLEAKNQTKNWLPELTPRVLKWFSYSKNQLWKLDVDSYQPKIDSQRHIINIQRLPTYSKRIKSSPKGSKSTLRRKKIDTQGPKINPPTAKKIIHEAQNQSPEKKTIPRNSSILPKVQNWLPDPQQRRYVAQFDSQNLKSTPRGPKSTPRVSKFILRGSGSTTRGPSLTHGSQKSTLRGQFSTPRCLKSKPNSLNSVPKSKINSQRFEIDSKMPNIDSTLGGPQSTSSCQNLTRNWGLFWTNFLIFGLYCIPLLR